MTEEQVFHGLLMIKLPALCKWVNNDTLNYLQQTVIPAKLCTHAKRWANSWIIAVNSEFLGSQAVFCLATTKESRAEKILFIFRVVSTLMLLLNEKITLQQMILDHLFTVIGTIVMLLATLNHNCSSIPGSFGYFSPLCSASQPLRLQPNQCW